MQRTAAREYPTGTKPHEVDELIADCIRLGPHDADHHYREMQGAAPLPLNAYWAYIFATVLWHLALDESKFPVSVNVETTFREELFGVFTHCSPEHAPPF